MSRGSAGHTRSTTLSRRRFIARAATAGAGLAAGADGSTARAQSPGRVRGFDHVALPLRNTEPMLAFYRGLGFTVNETPQVCAVLVGDGQMINFHRPELWQRASFTLRAPAATPPCGDLCFVWDGTQPDLEALLRRVKATIIEGPVERRGGRQTAATSRYVRDPDGNLLEFIVYP